MPFQIVSVTEGSMDDPNVRRRESAHCCILSCGLLRVIEKCTVRIHGSVHKIFASCVGVSCLVPGGVMGVDIRADHLAYLDIRLELKE